MNQTGFLKEQKSDIQRVNLDSKLYIHVAATNYNYITLYLWKETVIEIKIINMVRTLDYKYELREV